MNSSLRPRDNLRYLRAHSIARLCISDGVHWQRLTDVCCSLISNLLTNSATGEVIHFRFQDHASSLSTTSKVAATSTRTRVGESVVSCFKRCNHVRCPISDYFLTGENDSRDCSPCCVASMNHQGPEDIDHP